MPTKVHEEQPQKKCVVPEDYMCGQEDFIDIVARLKMLNDDQSELDRVYRDLLEGLKNRFKEVACGRKKQRQIWFSKELKALRKVIHKKEKAVLMCPGD